jgi:hypothetical protein
MHPKASKAKAPDTKQSPEKQEQKIMVYLIIAIPVCFSP